jgi:hypothetical protein
MSEGCAGGLGEHGVGSAGRKSDRDAAHAIGPAPAPASRLIPGTGVCLCVATLSRSPTVCYAQIQRSKNAGGKLSPAAMNSVPWSTALHSFPGTACSADSLTAFWSVQRLRPPVQSMVDVEPVRFALSARWL